MCVRKTENGNVRRVIKKKYMYHVQFSQAMAAKATKIETRNTLTKMFEKFTRINPLLKFT